MGHHDIPAQALAADAHFWGLPESTPKKWVEVPGADHDNVLITDYPIYADIAEWMLLYVPGK